MGKSRQFIVLLNFRDFKRSEKDNNSSGWLVTDSVGTLWRLFTIAVVFASSGLSCKDPYDDCDVSDFHQCHREQNLDSVAIANALLGRFRWEYAMNCSVVTKDGPKNSAAFAGVTIEFLNDGTCLVHRPNSTSTFHWSLSRLSNGSGFEIKDTTQPQPHFPPHDSLWGRVRLCGDRLLCNAGYVDGVDNFFIRD